MGTCAHTVARGGHWRKGAQIFRDVLTATRPQTGLHGAWGVDPHNSQSAAAFVPGNPDTNAAGTAKCTDDETNSAPESDNERGFKLRHAFVKIFVSYISEYVIATIFATNTMRKTLFACHPLPWWGSAINRSDLAVLKASNLALTLAHLQPFKLLVMELLRQFSLQSLRQRSLGNSEAQARLVQSAVTLKLG